MTPEKPYVFWSYSRSKEILDTSDGAIGIEPFIQMLSQDDRWSNLPPIEKERLVSSFIASGQKIFHFIFNGGIVTLNGKTISTSLDIDILPQALRDSLGLYGFVRAPASRMEHAKPDKIHDDTNLLLIRPGLNNQLLLTKSSKPKVAIQVGPRTITGLNDLVRPLAFMVDEDLRKGGESLPILSRTLVAQSLATIARKWGYDSANN